ncbi:MAG: GAF domain-containing protein [Anaerolineaceae bacterium]|nr:GAF domain-containing protein [Anaerolineaceae bacterium]
MSKDRLYNQLEELFSSTKATPAVEQPQPVRQPVPQPVSPTPERRAPEAVMETLPERRGYVGWEDFLDGIRRKRSFGFIFDSSKIRPLDGLSQRPGKNALSLPLQTSGEMFGRLVLEDGDKSWSENHRMVVSAVAERLSQQVDNLRLLDEAERYRLEAEQALAHLSQKGWQDFLVDEKEDDLVFVYDQNQVKPGIEENQVDRAELSVPLSVRDNVLGEVWFNGITDLNTDAQNLLAAVTQQLSTHLDNLRLSQQREISLTEVEGLYEISAELSATTTLQGALMAVSRPAIATGAKRCSLYRILGEGQREISDEVELVAHWERDTSGHVTPLGMRFDIKELPSYQAWFSSPDKPFMVPDVSAVAPSSVAGAPTDPDFKGFLLLPLKTPEVLVGIITVYFENERLFSRADERLYSALAQQAAVVVNNLLLFEQVTRRASDMETVTAISTEISHLLDPEVLLNTVVSRTQKGFNIYHAQIYVYDEEIDSLNLSASSGEVGDRLLEKGHAISMAEEHSLVTRAARTRQEIIVSDTRKESDFLPNELLPDTRAEMAIPMIVGDQLLGVFDIQDSRLNRFSQLERQIFITLTSQVAVALQNARLYLEQEETVQRLRELDHLKSDFLANMSHELRTPLNSIMGFTDVILLGLDGPLTEQMENDLKLVEKNGKHLLSLINNVLDMSKIEAGRMTLSLEKFDLQSLLEEAMDIASPLIREKSLELDLTMQSGETFEILADRVRMRQVMINILGNAVKFTEEGDITISVVKPRQDSVRIEVHDTGIGIPPNKLDMIFESFNQIDTTSTRKVGGTGLGLPISRKLVKMHGGRLWAESTGIEGEGSTFIVEIPLNVG